MSFNVRLNGHYIVPLSMQCIDYVNGRGLTEIINIRFKSQAKARYFRLATDSR